AEGRALDGLRRRHARRRPRRDAGRPGRAAPHPRRRRLSRQPPALPRRAVPLLHAARLPGRDPPHAPQVRPRRDAPPRRRVPGDDGLRRTHPLRATPPPPRRRPGRLRRLEPPGGLPHWRPLRPRGETPDARLVGPRAPRALLRRRDRRAWLRPDARARAPPARDRAGPASWG